MKVKGKKYQILAWGLCVVLALGMIYMIQVDKKRILERNIQLQQQVQRPEKNYEEIAQQQLDIYDRLYSELQVPEIVCWGDSLMTGNSGDSLTASLNSVLTKNLFKNLTNTFHAALEDGERTTPSCTIINMGVENEELRQILVRAGANRLYLGEDIDVSSSVEPVPVLFSDEEVPDDDKDEKGGEDEYGEFTFADQKIDTFGQVTISGIRGTLQKSNDWIDPTHPKYVFIRNHEGDPQKIEAGTRVELENASKYIGDVPVFYFENISNLPVDDIILGLKKLVERYADTNNWTDDNETDPEQETVANNYNLPFVLICRTTEGSNLDKSLKDEFGEHYICTSIYSSEMRESAFLTLAQDVYKSLDNQGCFTDIREQIRRAVEEANNI